MSLPSYKLTFLKSDPQLNFSLPQLIILDIGYRDRRLNSIDLDRGKNICDILAFDQNKHGNVISRETFSLTNTTS